MAQSCIKANWGRVYSLPETKGIFLDAECYRSVMVKFGSATTKWELSLQEILHEDIDRVFEECKYEGWSYDENEPARELNAITVNQAKEFSKYLHKIKTPKVIPYQSGNIGFEWNINNDIIISVIFNFEEQNQFIFSIITPETSECGTTKQNPHSQLEFAKRIMKELKDVQ